MPLVVCLKRIDPSRAPPPHGPANYPRSRDHDSDWAYRLIKTSFGSYVLDPNDPNTLGGIDNIFGIRVVTSTQCPQGTAVVLDSKIAATVWMRMSMEILSNQFGDYEFQHNEWAFRAEERFGLGVQYSKAICVITGLSTTLAAE